MIAQLAITIAENGVDFSDDKNNLIALLDEIAGPLLSSNLSDEVVALHIHKLLSNYGVLAGWFKGQGTPPDWLLGAMAMFFVQQRRHLDTRSR